MKRTLYTLAALCCILSCTGCATIKKDIASGRAASNARAVAGTALSLGAMAQPQYAGTIAQIQALLAAPDKSSAIDGFEFSRTFRYRGSICEAEEITWTDAWTKLSTADSGIPAPADKTNSTAATPPADAQLRTEIGEILDAAGIGDDQ